MLGIHRAGGLAEEMVWRSDRLVPVGDLEPKLAALLPDAVATAYHAVARIQWPGAYYRRDIGYRALQRVSA